MPAFGKIEKRLAQFISHYPGLKRSLKGMYQTLNYSFYRPSSHVQLAEGIQMDKPFENEDCGNFWGYYDSSPENQGDFLAHSFSLRHQKKFPYSSVMDIKVNGEKVSETNAWNWQQGSRLFWSPNKTILHNVFEQGEYQCKITDLVNGSIKFLNAPIFAYHRQLGIGLGLSPERLTKLDPAYGYFAHDKGKPLPNDQADGIFKIDLKKNEKKLLISFDQLKNLDPKPGMSESRHGVNHLQFSPKGNRFMFLHRWYPRRGKYFSRLISASSDGSELCILSDDDMVSHCNWKDENHIIGWMRKKREGEGYFLHKDQTSDYKQIGSAVLLEDGHPSFSPNGDYLLTDTYPDRARMSHLYLFGLKDKKLIRLASFYNPLRYNNEQRCDLHPRFASDGSVTVDTVHEGIRKQVQLNISNYL